MPTLKLKRTFKEMLDDVFLHKVLHQHTDTKADVNLLFFLAFFKTFFGLERQWQVVCNRQIDGHKGLWVTSLTCTRRGWRFWLVDCEKIPFSGGWWHVYWACQINKSNELSQVTITHTHKYMDKGRGKGSVLLMPPDPDVVHPSNTDLCVTLGFSELLQSCLTSLLLGERMWSECYFTNSALHHARIHAKWYRLNYAGKRDEQTCRYSTVHRISKQTQF